MRAPPPAAGPPTPTPPPTPARGGHTAGVARPRTPALGTARPFAPPARTNGKTRPSGHRTRNAQVQPAAEGGRGAGESREGKRRVPLIEDARHRRPARAQSASQRGDGDALLTHPLVQSDGDDLLQRSGLHLRPNPRVVQKSIKVTTDVGVDLGLHAAAVGLGRGRGAACDGFS